MKDINIVSLFRKTRSAKLTWTMLLPLIILLSLPSVAQAFWCGPVCKGLKGGGSDAAKHLSEAIKEFDTINIEDRDLDVLLEGTRGLIGYSTAQAEALMSHGGSEYRRSLSHSMDELAVYTQTLDEIAEQRIGQLDDISEARIRQTLEGIESETLLISNEMTKQILALEEAVKASSSHISGDIQSITVTASDELAKNIKVSRVEADKLLKASSSELQSIFSLAGNEVVELVQITSKETQQIIRTGGDEAQEFSIVTLDTFNEVAQDILEKNSVEAQASAKVVAEELRVVLSDVEGISRVLLADSAGHAIDVTDNLSEETQAVIEAGAKNLEELSSHVTVDALILNDALKESSLQIIEGSMFFIDRTADLTLAVIATGTGLLFIFISSYGLTKALLQWKIPDKYAQRVILFSFMGTTVIASFTPFTFSIPSMRARVLVPMAQAKAFTEVVPGVGQRIPREIQPISYEEKRSQHLPETTTPESCAIQAIEHIRSEPSSHQGYKTVVTTASTLSPVELEVTGKQTPKGWIEALNHAETKVWVHKSVISNFEAVQDCVSANKNTSRSVIPDIKPPAPPAPKTVKPLAPSQASTRQSANPAGNSRASSSSPESAAVLKRLGISDREKRALKLSPGDITTINRLTNVSFRLNHPELNRRKIRDDETELRIQWRKMRKCKVLVDHLFYRNHPELNRRKIRSNETNLASEWRRIRAGLDGCQ
ncbi:MAG: hypothetical protein AAFN40_15095 [Cyanobacteria bacterium J06560_6]